MNTFVAVKGEDHLTVTPGPELVAAGILGADVTVVIDFAVNRQYLLPVGRIKRLSSALRIDYGKAFVCQDGTSATIHSTPVGPAVTYFACHSESLVPEFPALNLYIEDSCYSTHNCNCFKGFMFL